LSFGFRCMRVRRLTSIQPVYRVMFKNIRIGIKLPLTIMALCSVALGIMGYLATSTAYSILETQGHARLQGALHRQADSFLGQLDALQISVASQSISPVTRKAITTLIGAFEALPGDKTATLQTRFITENEHPAGQKQLLDYTAGRDAYNRAHRGFHPYFRSIVEKNSFADLYLLDGEGNVLYSVMKNADFAISLRAEGRAEDGFSRAYERVMAGSGETEFVFEDFSDYALELPIYSAFMATPVLASNGAIVGVFIARVNAASLAVGADHEGALGETGTAGVIAPDGRVLRSTDPAQTPGDSYDITDPSDPIARALSGESDVATRETAGSRQQLAAFLPISFHTANWAVVAQQNTDELFADAKQLQRTTLYNGAALMLVAAMIAIFMSRAIISPLTAVGTAMGRVSEGDYESEIAGTDRFDEVGGIARTLDGLRRSLFDGRVAEAHANLLGEALETTTACLMIIESDLTVTHVNKAAASLLDTHFQGKDGWNASDLEGRRLDEFCHQSDRIAACLNDPEGRGNGVDIRLGEARITLVVQPVRDVDGACRNAVIEWKDKTKEFHQTALIGSIDQQQCHVGFDLDGKVTEVNANFLTLWGGDEGSVMGKSAENLIVVDPAKLPDGSGFLTELMSQQAVWGKFKIRGTGSDAWIDGGFTVVTDNGGDPLGITLIGKDITNARAALEVAEADRKEIQAAQHQVVTELGAGLSRLSDGDLTVQITTPFAGQYEVLRNDFNSALGSLLRAMRGLVTSADSIQRGATEMSGSADDLLERTKTQAATLAGTSAEISQLSSSVAEAADRAQTTRKIVVDARENAIASGAVVEDAIAAMGEIEQSSQTISTITKVIDEISFQTNLLALNAGVEAARAGDAGRGFAVVASEVRALAQRSSNAAREINQVISETNHQIEKGVKLVGGAGQALEQIFASVKGIADNVGEIAQSAVTQSAGLREIDQSVGQLDQVTRQNAEKLSDTAASGHRLKNEANALTEANARFNVGTTPGTGACRASTPASAGASVQRPPSPSESWGSTEKSLAGSIEDWDNDRETG